MGDRAGSSEAETIKSQTRGGQHRPGRSRSPTNQVNHQPRRGAAEGERPTTSRDSNHQDKRSWGQDTTEPIDNRGRPGAPPHPDRQPQGGMARHLISATWRPVPSRPIARRKREVPQRQLRQRSLIQRQSIRRQFIRGRSTGNCPTESCPTGS